MINGDDRGTVGGMSEWQGKRKYSEKIGPVVLCPPQNPHYLTPIEPGPPRWEADD
jgi:hypothetical protein